MFCQILFWIKLNEFHIFQKICCTFHDTVHSWCIVKFKISLFHLKICHVRLWFNVEFQRIALTRLSILCWLFPNTSLIHFVCLSPRGLTLPWLLSQSPLCGRKLSTSPSLSWTPASVSCTVDPTTPTPASSRSWTPWPLISGSTFCWHTWESAVYSSSSPGERQHAVTINLHGTLRYLLWIHSVKHQRASSYALLVVFA